jgi:hypothetical protein
MISGGNSRSSSCTLHQIPCHPWAGNLFRPGRELIHRGRELPCSGRFHGIDLLAFDIASARTISKRREMPTALHPGEQSGSEPLSKDGVSSAGKSPTVIGRSQYATNALRTKKLSNEIAPIE